MSSTAHQGPEPVPLQPLDVRRLAEHRHAARQEPHRRLVEVVGVQVRDDDAVEVAHDVLRRQRQRTVGFGTGLGVLPMGGRAPCLVEHRVDQQSLAAELDEEGRMADERQAHAATIERRISHRTCAATGGLWEAT